MPEGDSTAPPARPTSGHAGRKRLLVSVVVAVVIVASIAGAVYVLTRGTQPPPPSIGLDHVTVTSTSGKTSADQAELLTLTASAVDTEGTDQTRNATFRWIATPSNAVEIHLSGVPYTVRVLGVLAQSVTIAANATHNNTSQQASIALTINPLHFGLSSSVNAPEVGMPFGITVKALRADSSIASTYRGTVHFTSDDTGATLPDNYPYTAGDPGSHVFSVTLSRAGAATITVRDTNASISGTLTVTGNHAPHAIIGLTPNSADPREVALDGSASSDADGDPLTYGWEFGDGSPRVTTPTVTHRYAKAGSYQINLTVADTHGATGRATTPYAAKAPPTARFIMQPMQPLGSDFNATADASASSDPDGIVSAFDWDWGDGNMSSESTPLASHVYNQSYDGRTVTIRLSVKDNDGLTNATSKNVLVTLQQFPPTADFTYATNQDTRTASVDAGNLSSDPNANIASFNWSWGDGNYTNGTSPTASHTYGSNGDFVVNLTVVDTTDLKGWAEKTVRIHQQPLPPTAVFSVTRSLMQVSADASASTDPNENILSYTFAWGDGTTTGPQAGALANHTYSSPGLKTITLTVTDSTSLTGTATRKVSVNTSTLDYTYYDFFNVPYGEWWDYRFATYGDLPINADCFNQTSIADHVCLASDPNIPDYETYPYTDWYPLPGNTGWNDPANNPMIYAPYRFHVEGVNVPGYNRSEPVFLPVLNYSQPAGSRLDFHWRMGYLDKATGEYLTNVSLCQSVDPAAYDGFYIRSQIELTMDLQESKRIFNVKGTDAASAQSWWDANTNADCFLKGTAETNVNNWVLAMGGGSSSASGVGKYDITNSFEWYYQSYYLNMTAKVDPDGTTHVFIDHAAWGTEVMLARMFYWGNASYKENYLDSTKARGWWGMELGWFEDFDFAGSLGAPGAGFNFNLTSAMEYHFQHLTDPGPNAKYDRTDDVPYWNWGPILTDYTNDFFTQHFRSELDRYPNPPYKYVHSTPGGNTYGQNRTYDFAPIRWDLRAGQTWHFQFPTGNVVFYNPNLTPVPANPQGAYVSIASPLKFNSTKPADYGDWDNANMTWDVYGPASPGGPVGSPGLDGIPGTEDDAYALDPWPIIRFMDPPTVGGLSAKVDIGTGSSGLALGDGNVVTSAALMDWSTIEARTVPAAPRFRT